MEKKEDENVPGGSGLEHELGACRYLSGSGYDCVVTTREYCYSNYGNAVWSWTPNINCFGGPLPGGNRDDS